jgi:hypothetical protein
MPNENVSGYLSNYHPLCGNCSDDCLGKNDVQSNRLTYHYRIGDLIVVNNIKIPNNIHNQN